MDNEKFIFKCKQLVADYANENFDKTDQTQITVDKGDGAGRINR